MTAVHEEQLTTITNFLTEIGIEWREGDLPAQTFVPGIGIVSGTIVFDRKTLLYPGDLLHEAGHIAVTLPEERQLLTGDVVAVDPNKNGDEMAVLLWSWLAARHCKLPSSVVFHENGYKGDGEWLSEQFDSGNYMAAPLLQWMRIIDKVEAGQVPQVINWLRN